MRKLTQENYEKIIRLIFELETTSYESYSEELKKNLRPLYRTEENRNFIAPMVEIAGDCGLSSYFEQMIFRNKEEEDKYLASMQQPADSSDGRPPTILELERKRKSEAAKLRNLKAAHLTSEGRYDIEDSIFDDYRLSAAYDLLQLGINRTTPELFERLLRDFIHFDIHKSENRLKKLDPNSYTPPSFIKHAASDPAVSPDALLSEKWEEYVKDKKDSNKWAKESVIAERNAEFRDLLEIIEGDIPCANFSKDLAKQFRSRLVKFPKNRRKKYGDTPLNEIPKDAEVISPSTAKQRLSYIKGFFDYLREEGCIAFSPFENIVIKAEKVSYGTYTQNDIEQLFNLPKKLVKKPWQFWIPRIALYSGARQNEIAQLSFDDIAKDADTDIWFFKIHDEGDRSVKTQAAIRRVPIHSELIRNGFLDYVNSLHKSHDPNDSLWDGLAPKRRDGKLGSTVSDYWTRLKKQHNYPEEKVDFAGKKKVFHSLRRVVINKLQNSGVSMEILQLLIGHEPSIGVTSLYMDWGDVPLEQLKDAIEQLKIDGVGWE